MLGITLASPAYCAETAILTNGFAIRHERREIMGQTTRLYLSASEPSSYVDIASDRIGSFESETILQPSAAAPPASAPPAAQPATVDDFITEASEKHRIDRALIESVIKAESAFNPRAVSRKGAKGLMQLMPATAAELGVNDAFDPRANIEAGTRYLQHLLVKYNQDLAKALAAYNAGPHRVEQYNGVPPYRETHAYVVKVISEFNRKKLAERGGLVAASRAQPAPRSTQASTTQPAGASAGGQR